MPLLSRDLIISNTRLSVSKVELFHSLFIFWWPITVNVAYCSIVCARVCEVTPHILTVLWCIRHGAGARCSQSQHFRERNRELSHMQPHHKSNCNSQINCSVTQRGAPASLSHTPLWACVCVCCAIAFSWEGCLKSYLHCCHANLVKQVIITYISPFSFFGMNIWLFASWQIFLRVCTVGVSICKAFITLKKWSSLQFSYKYIPTLIYTNMTSGIRFYPWKKLMQSSISIQFSQLFQLLKAKWGNSSCFEGIAEIRIQVLRCHKSDHNRNAYILYMITEMALSFYAH